MQVILKEDHPGLGFVGDLVKVRNGFARNFLIPQKIALPANPGNIKMLEHQKRVLEVKKAQRKTEAEQLKGKIEKISITVRRATSSGDRLFGSVTLVEIHDELTKAGITVDRKLIRLNAPIKITGNHTVEIKLHQDVAATVTLTVEPLEEIKKEAKKEAKAPVKKSVKKSVEKLAETSAKKPVKKPAAKKTTAKKEKEKE